MTADESTDPEHGGPEVEAGVRDLVRALFGRSASRPPRALPSVLGGYELLEVIGRGGAGIVYRARPLADPSREVAIKVLGSPSVRDRERLCREAQMLASLEHPGVVRVHGIDHDGDEIFLVLELVRGGSLAARLRQGRLPRAEALRASRQILEAMAHVHAAGIVHRDIKPANVLVDESGRARLLDFGLAKMPSGVALTGEEAFGTPAYMAPEQRRSASRATPRSDVYALGLVLFEVLTGARMTCTADLTERPVFTMRDGRLLARVSLWLVPVIASALASDPARRPADAGALARAFDRALERDRWSRSVGLAVLALVVFSSLVWSFAR